MNLIIVVILIIFINFAVAYANRRPIKQKDHNTSKNKKNVEHIGKAGEKRISHILSTILDKDSYLWDDFLFKTENGTNQIDHIYINKSGIFVIETKNMKGIISGDDYDQYWIKNVFGHKYKFYNPLLQNKAHINNLANLFNLPESYFKSIIVFINNYNLKLNFHSSELITKSDNLINLIYRFQEEKFTIYDIEKIKEIIDKNQLQTKDDYSEHLKNVKEAQLKNI